MKIRVATFLLDTPPRLPLKKSRVIGYILWYNPEWAGCVIYEVEAKNGTEAKKLAAGLRAAAENAKETP